jgi:hypothetical protein
MALDAELTEKEPLVLTEREIAIARGEDPNAIETKAEQSADAGDKEVADTGTEAHSNTEPESVEQDAPVSWITPEVEAHAASYGLQKDRLAKFGTEEAYRLAASLLDENLIAAGKQGSEPAGEAQKELTPAQVKKLEKLDVEKYKTEGYDESTQAVVAKYNELVDELAPLREQVETQKQYFARLEQEQQAAIHAQHINEFHTASDTLDADLFGKVFQDGKLAAISKDQETNRRKLYETAETIVAGLYARAQAQGKTPEIPPMPVLLSRARDYAFAEQVRVRAEKQRAADLAEQGKRRRPAAGKPLRAAPAKADSDPVKAIANDPRVAQVWKKMQEVNGAEV